MPFTKPVFEPLYPPEWDIEEVWDVDDDYDEVPRGLRPES